MAQGKVAGDRVGVAGVGDWFGRGKVGGRDRRLV